MSWKCSEEDFAIYLEQCVSNFKYEDDSQRLLKFKITSDSSPQMPVSIGILWGPKTTF